MTPGGIPTPPSSVASPRQEYTVVSGAQHGHVGLDVSHGDNVEGDLHRDAHIMGYYQQRYEDDRYREYVSHGHGSPDQQDVNVMASQHHVGGEKFIIIPADSQVSANSVIVMLKAYTMVTDCRCDCTRQKLKVEGWKCY
jgi:hypothetical protein